MLKETSIYKIVIISILITVATPSLAYLGPGGSISTIGAFVALSLAVVAAIFGFVWYPLKRIIKSKKQKKEE